MTARMTDEAGRDQRRTEGARSLSRSRSNHVLAGVCGGVADYYQADARAVRLLAILVAVFTGIFPMVFVYLIAAIVLPAEGTAPTPRSAAAGQAGWILGGILIVGGIAGIATIWLHVSWDMLWPIALITFGALIVALTTRPGH